MVVMLPNRLTLKPREGQPGRASSSWHMLQMLARFLSSFVCKHVWKRETPSPKPLKPWQQIDDTLRSVLTGRVALGGSLGREVGFKGLGLSHL